MYKLIKAALVFSMTALIFLAKDANAVILTPTPPPGWYAVLEVTVDIGSSPAEIIRVQEWKNDFLGKHAWVAIDVNDQIFASGTVVATPHQVDAPSVCTAHPGALDSWRTTYFANGAKVLDLYSCDNAGIFFIGYMDFAPPYAPLGHTKVITLFTCYGALDCNS